jgi:hypothetical protein
MAFLRWSISKLSHDARSEKTLAKISAAFDLEVAYAGPRVLSGKGCSETLAMSRAMIAVAILSVVLPNETHAQGKGIRLWNLTTSTITGFQLSPAGRNAWGPNQTLNDKDKEVDHDERLRITGVEPGHYDAKISYGDKRQCVVRDIDIKPDAVFSVSDKDLTDCSK